MPVDTLVGVVLMLAPRPLFPLTPTCIKVVSIMLAGGDLIMTVLAVGMVRGHGTPP